MAADRNRTPVGGEQAGSGSPRRGEPGGSLWGAAVLAVGALLALAGVVGLSAGAFRPTTAPALPAAATTGTRLATTRLAGAIATPSLAQQASLARWRLAVNLKAPHAGHPEAITHPWADFLGSSIPGRRARTARANTPMQSGTTTTTTTTTVPGGSTTTSTSTTSTSSTSTTTVPPPPEPIGIDVSSHQGNVNWSAVAAAGNTFAWVKATEGTYYVDSTYFPQQYNGSYAAGLIRGAYHFAIPNNSTGAAQADFFVANGGGWSPDGRTLPGMLDFENNPYGPECYGMTPAQLIAWVQSFDNEYQYLTGRYPALYTNANFWNTCTHGSPIAAVDPLDLAAWGSSPTPVPGGWTSPTVWQYTNNNQWGYDGDMFLGNAAALQNFALDPSATPPPTTTTTTVPCVTTTTPAACVTTTLPAPTTTTTTTTLPPPPPPPPPSNLLTAGEVLTRGHAIVSANERFEVIMQRDGNLVEYIVHGRALWQSHTYGHPGNVAVLPANGNLEVVASSGKLLWQTRTTRSGRTHAVIQDDANFVLYPARGRAVWATGTEGK